MAKTITLEIEKMHVSIVNGNVFLSSIKNLLQERQFVYDVGWFGVNNYLKNISVIDVEEKDIKSIQTLLNEFIKTAAETTL